MKLNLIKNSYLSISFRNKKCASTLSLVEIQWGARRVTSLAKDSSHSKQASFDSRWLLVPPASLCKHKLSCCQRGVVLYPQVGKGQDLPLQPSPLTRLCEDWKRAPLCSRLAGWTLPWSSWHRPWSDWDLTRCPRLALLLVKEGSSFLQTPYLTPTTVN